VFEITTGMSSYEKVVAFHETLDRVQRINMDYDDGYLVIDANPGDTIGLLITSSSYYDLFEHMQHPFILTAEIMLEG